MLTVNEPYLYEKHGWSVRIRPPDRPDAPRFLILIHGYTGDENVMWVFAQKLPRDYWIFSPRGLVKAETGGYSWLPAHHGLEATLVDFKPAVEGLLALLKSWSEETGIVIEGFSLMGFSQGAALAYSLALTHPGRVDRIAGLAGFLPLGVESLVDRKPLSGKSIFVAHGTRDDTVPVGYARQTVHLLEQAGGDVVYCEESVGHKLSKNCFTALTDFFG